MPQCKELSEIITILQSLAPQKSNNFKIITTLIDYILSSKRFENEFGISKSEFSQQVSLFIYYYYFI